jgi:hypothetical protein
MNTNFLGLTISLSLPLPEQPPLQTTAAGALAN